MGSKNFIRPLAHSMGLTVHELCQRTVRKFDGNINRAAYSLGLFPQSLRRYLSIPDPIKKIPEPSQDEIENNYRRLPLASGEYALVDPTDYDWLMQWKWHSDHSGGVKRGIRIDGKPVNIALSRQLMNAPDDMQVDHINGNRLDNRRCNLRICTPRENSRNRRKPRTNPTSQYKGVYFSKQNNRWQAHIYTSRIRTYLGSYKDELEAARAYDEAARKYHGEFARLNFPDAPATRDEGQAQP